MNDGFTRKKVESLTLGEKLKKLRSDARLSLTEISKATRIQVKYLEYLENGEYKKLPADVYVRGFLRSYARYLNIDEQAFVKLYERECNIQKNLGHEELERQPSKNFSTSSLVITPKSVIVAMMTLSIFGAFFYLYQEFRSFAAVPRLVILEPGNNATVDTSEVNVRGKTDKGAQVSINGQSVFVGSEGDFSDKLIVQPGRNTVTIVAVNRFNEEKVETLSIEAKYILSEPESLPDTVGADIVKSFRLSVGTHEKSATVSILVDGVVVFSGLLNPKETKTFEAKEKIMVTSESGNQVFVRFNEGEEAVLSANKGASGEVGFSKEGRQE